MRLGGPLHEKDLDPEAWVRALQQQGYRAAYCPVSHEADGATVAAYEAAAARADIVIAEVGAWSNPISPDDETRRAAVSLCQQRLDLADRIGARCCVNISGSRGTRWDGPSPDNYTEDTFALIVDTVREIIDAVRPVRTYYTLETMPWVFPDSVESYALLIEAIDRPRFAVHFDPVNLVNSPRRYADTGALLREAIGRLGPRVRSCHAKDILLQERLTVHLDEVRPGLGGLDYRTFLRELDRLDPDTPLMLEHLPDPVEYRLAARYVRGIAEDVGVRL